MKRIPASLLLTTFLLSAAALPTWLHSTPLIAQNVNVLAQDADAVTSEKAPASEFSYRFYGQDIPLNLRKDQIAVEFTPQTGSTRGINTKPNYLKLQDALRSPSAGGGTVGGTRGGSASPGLDVEIQPLGARYALVTLPKSRARSFDDTLAQRLDQSYVAAQLPVFQRPESDVSIVLPNEIVVSFEPGMAESRAKATLARFGLEVIRPLRFSQNRYLVKSSRESGSQILAVANQLTTITGIQSATPNFVQTVPYGVNPLNLDDASLGEPPLEPTDFDRLVAASSSQSDSTQTDSAKDPGNPLLPLHWHLDSRPKQKVIRPRTDVRATDVWKQGNQGEGTVVAVIDSLIQWDHPDLAANLYRMEENSEDRLPGEVHGWDFSARGTTCSEQGCQEGDPDTRLSDEELALLGPHFRNAFSLSDEALLEAYPNVARSLRYRNPDLSTKRVATIIRNYIQHTIASEFHGTWSAGVIAATPANVTGAVGVAPKAKILPVRVFGVNGEITSASLIEAIGYSAARGVDVINMSLGGLLPNQDLVSQIFAIQDAYPDLVIVASAGNESLDGVGFPAAIPGVLSVGAINLEGQRTAYSSYGGQLDVVAPGGDTSLRQSGGILTTGGTGMKAWWQGIEPPKYGGWGPALDPLGQYVRVQGTSFSAPAVSGVVALMRGADPQKQMGREQLLGILRDTAGYESLKVTQADRDRYRLQRTTQPGTILDLSAVRPSGISKRPEPVSAEEYFFGRGLVNAAAAVAQMQQQKTAPSALP